MLVVREERRPPTGITAPVLVLALTLLLLAATSFLGPPIPAAAAVEGREPDLKVRTDLRRELFRMTNSTRERRDRRSVALARRVCRYAARHTRRMAESGHLYHSTNAQLRNALRGTGWRVTGENIGVGSSVRSVHRAFMDSDAHRDNILRRAFDHAAVGVVTHDDRVWTTVIFYGD